uniref:CSON000682 protein n=1 Tax=Culicoides sonorensis TaxID=179676 RepID=A0A336LT99_CULSO
MNSLKDLDEQRDSNLQENEVLSDSNNSSEQENSIKIEETSGNGANNCEQQLHNNQSTTKGEEVELVMAKSISIECNQKAVSDNKEKHRKVSFPHDRNLVTGYLEPVNPWDGVLRVSSDKLCDFYKESCIKHKTDPLEVVLNHLATLQDTNESREAILDLHNQILTHENVETLEEILKRVQYKVIDVSGCNLDDVSATAIFDMVEYYEAANELNISENKDITNRGWLSSINMVKRSQALKTLEARGVPISEISASNLGKALVGSCLHTIKLEHCGMTGRPVATFCHALRKVNVLKELWLANNDLNSFDAYNIGCLLKVNYSIQFLDISNNNIQDEGISYLADALIQQNNSIRNPISENSSSRIDYSELSASLNLLNNNKSLSPSFKKPTSCEKPAAKPIHLLSKSNINNNLNDDEDDDANISNMKQKEKSPPPPPAEIVEEKVVTPSLTESQSLSAEETDEEVQSILQKTPEMKIFDRNVETFSKVAKDEVTLQNEKLSALRKAISVEKNCIEKEIKPTTNNPERSLSSESLNSLTSIDSNDSKSSIRITEAKFAKNGTLERQQSVTQKEESTPNQTGLQVLLLWNNKLTKNSSKSFSDLISATTIMEVLNIGRNNIGNDFLMSVRSSLKTNSSLESLGLQACHLSCPGIKILAEVLEFGGNSTLQRIDLRDNNIQTEGLEALNDALKSNKSVTQIDLDDTPRKLSDSFDSTSFNRLINNIRAHCKRNLSPPVSISNSEQQPNLTTVEASVRKIPIPSRKISLTCQNVPPQQIKNTDMPTTIPSSITTIKSPPNNNRRNLLTTSSSLPSSFSHHSTKIGRKHKQSSHDTSKNRLKSPLPSPIVSPLASPRNRFQVSKVNESKLSCSSVELSPSPTFFPTSRFSVTRVNLPPTSSSLLTPSSTLSDSALSSSSTSLDSMDQHNDMNVSMSSTDSFDFILRDVPSIETKYIKCPDSIKEIQPLPCSDKENIKINDSLSSLEISVSSQDSLDIPQEEFLSPKVSSNEGTLTNSPCKSPENELNVVVEAPRSTTTQKTNDKRTRKNSWMNVSKGESTYPATLDKLLSLFQPTNISQIFNRSSPDSLKKEELQTKKETNTVGGIFAMVGFGNSTKREIPDNIETLQPIMTNVLQPNQSSDSTGISVTQVEQAVSVDNLSNALKNEVKENISPENTITATSVTNIKPQSQINVPVLVEEETPEQINLEHKVIFELGGEDDVSSSAADQNELLKNASETSTLVKSNNPNEILITPSTEYSKVVQIGLTGFGLGNIARDSLSIIKGGVNTSQDSMRSLDSLPEFEQYETNNEENKESGNMPGDIQINTEQLNKETPQKEEEVSSESSQQVNEEGNTVNRNESQNK